MARIAGEATGEAAAGDATGWYQALDRRNPRFDGLRGVAILYVMVYHLTRIERPSGPLESVVAGLTSMGWSGVDLFFVLSGFLITGILFDARNGRHYFRNFYMRRTLRIFPLYYAVVFLCLVVMPNLPEGVVPLQKAENFARIEGDEIWYWLYLSNFAIASAEAFRHAILDISWSLAIEEQFYAVWPLVVLACGRKSLMIACAAVVCVSPFVRAAFLAADFTGVSVYVMTPTRLDPLAMGAFVALAARGEGGVSRLVGPAKKLGLAGLAGVALVCGWQSGFGYALPLTSTIGLSLVALLCVHRRRNTSLPAASGQPGGEPGRNGRV